MAVAPTLRHAAEAAGGEFVLEQDGRRVGELTYSLGGGRMVIRHTGVAPRCAAAARRAGSSTRRSPMRASGR